MNAGDRFPQQFFAWDGVSCCLPADWHLAHYHYKAEVVYLRFEDDYFMRLEVEWTWPKQAPQFTRVRARYHKQAESLAREASEYREYTELPDGWAAFAYHMPDGNTLLTAYYADRYGPFFGFFKGVFRQKDKVQPRQVAQLLGRSLRLHKRETVQPWAVYDVCCALPTEFALYDSVFQAGRKHLIMHWKYRKFYLWYFSLANLLLENVSVAEFAKTFLEWYPHIKGPKWYLDDKGEVQWQRSKWHPFGHTDEVARRCKLYKVHYEHQPDRNRIVMWVFNYRHRGDLNLLERVDTDYEPPRH